MSNPLALLPLALAAGGGRLRASDDIANEYETQQLVAAGLTLLQRSASLVRALSGRRSAILLPATPTFLTALAASDGRGAVLVNPIAAPAEIEYQCTDANVGAVFTNAALASHLPAGITTVLLDAAPRTARVIAGGVARDVDLGSHHGLSLEGERDVPGRDEEAAIVYTSAIHGPPFGTVLTHANLLANARAAGDAAANVASDHVLALVPFSHPFALTAAAGAPLLAGGRITTMAEFDPVKATELLADGVTEIVGEPAQFLALLSAIARRGVTFRGGALRLCVCGGAPLSAELRGRWGEVTGVELRYGHGLADADGTARFLGPVVRGD